MASALPGNVCVGQHSVCIIRAARLDESCISEGGPDAGFVTTGIITATATPEFTDGAPFEPLTGCGKVAWAHTKKPQIRRYALSGELTYFDHEAMFVLFGGNVVVGATGTPFEGKNIGWASPWHLDSETPANVYLEFITAVSVGKSGGCLEPDTPAAVGHIFPKASLNPGERTMEFDAATLSFEGFSVNNPNMDTGPWRDWPGVGYIPNSGYVQVSYSADEYDAIMSTVGCGFAPTMAGMNVLIDDDGNPLIDESSGLMLMG